MKSVSVTTKTVVFTKIISEVVVMAGTKIYLDSEMKTYTYAETPGAVITDIQVDRLENGAHLELFKVQYNGLKTVYVVLIDRDGNGETLEYKTKKSAQDKYNKLLEVTAFSAGEWDAEEWGNFRFQALKDGKKWKKIC